MGRGGGGYYFQLRNSKRTTLGTKKKCARNEFSLSNKKGGNIEGKGLS